MHIRTASMADLAAVAAVEGACFPAAEAATEKDFAARLAVYPNHFWLLEEDDGTLVSFVNGLVTEGERYQLLERDALRFAADRPYRFENMTNSTGRLLLFYQYLK